jgi:hypothetical protein
MLNPFFCQFWRNYSPSVAKEYDYPRGLDDWFAECPEAKEFLGICWLTGNLLCDWCRAAKATNSWAGKGIKTRAIAKVVQHHSSEHVQGGISKPGICTCPTQRTLPQTILNLKTTHRIALEKCFQHIYW